METLLTESNGLNLPLYQVYEFSDQGGSALPQNELAETYCVAQK
jgi:hypothetical protein